MLNQKEWFDDMSEALVWMTNLSIYCSSNQRAKITEALDRVREVMSEPQFHLEVGKPVTFSIITAFSSAYEVVVSSQRVDTGK